MGEGGQREGKSAVTELLTKGIDLAWLLVLVVGVVVSR